MIGQVYMSIDPSAVRLKAKRKYSTPIAVLTTPRATKIIRFVAGLARNHRSAIKQKSRKNAGTPSRYGTAPG